MNTTRIEWATMTWNPITGCSPISEGCQNCYAARMAHRLAGRCGYDKDNPFGVTLHRDKLDEPLKIRKSQRIFVCSMGDLFHEDVPDKWLFLIWDVFRKSFTRGHGHKFLILTKRPERMRDFAYRLRWDHDGPGHYWLAKDEASHEGGSRPLGGHGCTPYANVYLGVTAENQARADERIPVLLSIPAAGHFVSVEPMLGEVDIYKAACHGVSDRQRAQGKSFLQATRLDWVICGAETGPKKREMIDEWVYDLERQCEEANVPFFGKKWSDGFPMSRREIPAGLEV